MTPPPPGSPIEVVEAAPRLVLRVPAGSPHARSLAVFALFWNVIAWVLAGAALYAAFQSGIGWGLGGGGNGNGPVPVWVLGFVGLFPGVGAALAVWWAKLRFTRTLILAEPGRVAVRTEWLGRERTRTISPLPGDRADLEVAWEEDDEPRHRVRVGPKAEKSRTVAFGGHLAEPDVTWLAAAINRAIRAEDPDAVGDELPTGPPIIVPAAATGDSHPHVGVRVDARGRATITVRMFPGWPPGKRVGVGFGVCFAVVWWTIVGVTTAGDLAEFRRNGDWSGLAFRAPFVLAGLALVSGLSAVCRATVRTTVGETFLTVRWGFGAFGYTRRVPRAQVAEVVIWENFGTTTTAAGTRKDPAAAVKVTGDGGDHLPLSIGGGREVAAAVAGRVRRELDRAGWEPADD